MKKKSAVAGLSETYSTVVFTGWKLVDSNCATIVKDGADQIIDPGDALFDAEDRLYSEHSGGRYSFENGTYGRTIHLMATWDLLNQVETNSGSFTGGDKYTNVMLVKGKLAFSTWNDKIKSAANCTIRGLDKESQLEICGNADGSGIQLSGPVIIDNIGLKGWDDTGRFGDRRGIFACSSKLILGVGIVGELHGYRNSVYRYQGVEVFGGNITGAVADETDVAIFSGIYSNIYAGPAMGSSSRTDLRIMGGSFLST